MIPTSKNEQRLNCRIRRNPRYRWRVRWDKPPNGVKSTGVKEGKRRF